MRNYILIANFLYRACNKFCITQRSYVYNLWNWLFYPSILQLFFVNKSFSAWLVQLHLSSFENWFGVWIRACVNFKLPWVCKLCNVDSSSKEYVSRKNFSKVNR